LTQHEAPTLVDRTEKGFEQVIESHLIAHGDEKGDPSDFAAG